MPIPAGSILPTVDDLKVELNITSTTHDVELQRKLDAAVNHLRSRGLHMDSEAVVGEVHRNVNTDRIVLKREPVLSVEAVTHADGTVYAATDYDLDPASGMLYVAYSGAYSRWYGQIVVDYTIGMSTLPEDLVEAVLLIAAGLWETQRGNAPSALPVNEDGFTLDPGGRPLISPKAETLIAPHMPLRLGLA